MPKQKSRYDDPRDEFVQSPEPITIRTLSKLYRGFSNCSESALYRRSREEGWVAQRDEFQRTVQAKADEKAAERIAKKRAVTLEELNGEAFNRTKAVLHLNMHMLKVAWKEREIDQPDGSKKAEKYFDMSPAELRIIQRNIRDAQHELRLYANFHPDRPVEAEADNSDDDHFLDELFSGLLGTPTESPADAES